MNGAPGKNLVKIRLSDGTVAPQFNPQNVAGKVTDLKLKNGRLWVAGAFSDIANNHQRALATINPATGRILSFFRGLIAGVHNGGVPTVLKMDITPSGDRLVAVGNFDTLDGVKRHQMFVLDTSGTTAVPAANFNTTFYQQACSPRSSPTCATWTSTRTAVRGRLHHRCIRRGRCPVRQRLPLGDPRDRCGRPSLRGSTTPVVTRRTPWRSPTRSCTQGATRVGRTTPSGQTSQDQAPSARPGIAALDPINGLPLSWNPTRTRGVGVFDFLHTADGLWVGSDTDRIGDFYLRSRIALLPHNDGTIIPAIKSAKLPNDVYMGYPLAAPPAPVTNFRVNAGGPEIAATPITWQSDATGNGFHNASLTRNTYAAVGSVDASVPADTPSSMFSTELTGNATTRDINWNIPTTSGQSLDVRLYFANRSTATASVGQRRFHIDVEGVRVQANFDVVAAVGHNKGMMRSSQVTTSDTNLDLDLVRSGIELPDDQRG